MCSKCCHMINEINELRSEIEMLRHTVKELKPKRSITEALYSGNMTNEEIMRLGTIGYSRGYITKQS